MPTVRFFTLGCKVNQYDTQSIRESFRKSGFKEIEDGRRADIYVINTCTVTSRADRKSRQLIHYSHRLNPAARIIVTGCYAELDSSKINKIPGVTHIVKNKDKDRIPELLGGHNKPHGPNGAGITSFKNHTRAFLKIQDGCDNFCSYCKVPLVRGILKSKPLDEIAREAKGLIKNGFKEIVLCGICLGAFGRDFKKRVNPARNTKAIINENKISNGVNLVDAIEAIEDIEGLLRIRLSSIEASDVSDKLIERMARSQKLCRHLHIPLQSGDDKILKKMHRKFSRQDYLNLIRKIRRRIPAIAITTDALVGFPGEGEPNFKNTLGLVKKICPLKTHIFPYSPRPGTAAYNFKDKVSPVKIKERVSLLKDIARESSLIYKKQFLNQDMDVLIEGHHTKDKGYWQGHTDNYIKVLVKSGQDLKNQLIRVRLKKIVKDCVLGVL
ncbi:MAG: tRNA (N(6)-L-threonylcarbamoyladenosine(37)-C(2))-methylthiotransferase MtaB [Candidatus Omnitrophica bacterium]|nr:tRNA (N(6)-L-threonylcarbamoyladenosine(37)-C(2))-methylthiotransferase MtaB [Candidatus Omnitrophota bacterium]MDD5592884.1 tRNA (N(6)-L-threonylcarbamoyladenosine(37)-C(2))-methylthiotransferase MtaB [Candidatus Omnitrophota bacterium]